MAMWTEAEAKKLRKLYARGIVGREAAAKIGRSIDSVDKKARQLHLTAPPQAAPAAAPIEKRAREEALRGVVRQGKERIRTLEKRLRDSEVARELFAEQIRATRFRHSTPIKEYFRTEAKIGIVSDSHFGSLWERLDLVKKAYAIMHRMGIRTVLHAGDVMEGTGMRKGHEFELALAGSDKQEAHVRDAWPEYKGMTTHFILGRHDLSFYKNTGHNPGVAIERDDFRFLRNQSISKHGVIAQIPLKVSGTTILVEMVHPGKGTAYALSYHPQRYVESLSGGQKPHIVIMGHYHKMMFLPQYRNVDVIQPGCLQSQTDWMKEMNLAAELGFCVLRIRATKVGLAGIGVDFTHFYERV